MPPPATPSPYYRETATFTREGVEQLLRVLDHKQTIQRCARRGAKVLDEIVLPITSSLHGRASAHWGISTCTTSRRTRS